MIRTVEMLGLYAVGLWAVLRLMRHVALGKWYLPDPNGRDFDG